ncbi:hypothetical protein GCM10027589_56630 [Actinocorallia lasiicapitis]
MLISLTSDLPDLPPIRFSPGLNVLPGPSGLVRLFDALLAADVRPGHPLRSAAYAGGEFALSLHLSGAARTVRRTARDPLTAWLDDEALRLIRLRARLGAGLFGLTGGGTEPSFRSVMAYYVRDPSAGGVAAPTLTYRKQRSQDAQPALAHLLGLDVDLVAKVREVGETERNLRELRHAARDSILGLTLGRSRDLDAQLRTLQLQRDAVAREVAAYRVAETYGRQLERADALSREIREVTDRLALSGRRLGELDQALAGEDGADADYVRLAYDEVGAALPELVVRRFAEVTAFHRSVVANRRRYLESEHARLLRERAADSALLRDLDEERAELLRLLHADGALAAHTELVGRLARLEGRIAELVERRAVVDRWSGAGRSAQLRSAELELQVGTDLHDRRNHLNAVSSRFAGYAFALFAEERPAALTIEPRRTGYRFSPVIGGPPGHEVRALTLFCFDLCLAVTALREGRGPDFLVHDAALFDDVPAELIDRALALAGRVCDEEGLQYVFSGRAAGRTSPG